HGTVDGGGMTGVVSSVVCERAERECVLSDVGRLSDQGRDEITAAYIVRQVAEEPARERIIPNILDETAAVGKRTRTLQTVLVEPESRSERGNDGSIPRGVDDGFMGERRIRARGARHDDRPRDREKDRHGLARPPATTAHRSLRGASPLGLPYTLARGGPMIPTPLAWAHSRARSLTAMVGSQTASTAWRASPTRCHRPHLRTTPRRPSCRHPPYQRTRPASAYLRRR